MLSGPHSSRCCFGSDLVTLDPHTLEVFRDGEVEILPERALQGSDPYAGRAAKILCTDGLAIVRLDEISGLLSDATSRSVDRKTLGPPSAGGVAHPANSGSKQVREPFLRFVRIRISRQVEHSLAQRVQVCRAPPTTTIPYGWTDFGVGQSVSVISMNRASGTAMASEPHGSPNGRAGPWSSVRGHLVGHAHRSRRVRLVESSRPLGYGGRLESRIWRMSGQAARQEPEPQRGPRLSICPALSVEGAMSDRIEFSRPTHRVCPVHLLARPSSGPGSFANGAGVRQTNTGSERMTRQPANLCPSVKEARRVKLDRPAKSTGTPAAGICAQLLVAAACVFWPALALAGAEAPIYEGPHDIAEDWARVIGWSLAALSAGLIVYTFTMRRKRLMEAQSKWLLFLGICVAPVPISLLSTAVGLEQSKRVEFCSSCPVMQPFIEDMKDPDSETLAALHFKNRYIQREQCYNCHSDYGIFGTMEAKLAGLGHIWKESTKSYELPIAISKPYKFTICLNCHAQALRFLEIEDHESAVSAVLAGESACLECHDEVHPPGEDRSE